MLNIEQTVLYTINNFEGHFFTDDPIDTGGATKFGITLRTLRYYRRMITGNSNLLVTKNDVKNLTINEAVKIGMMLFMFEPKIDKINDWKLRLLVYDYGFHSGQERAIQDLQGLLPVEPDGKIGPITISAVNSFINLNSSLLLAMRFLTKREEFMQNLITRKPSQRKYLFGWWKRTTKVQHTILEM